MFGKRQKQNTSVNEIQGALPEGSPFCFTEDKKLVRFGEAPQTIASPKAVASLETEPDEKGFFRSKEDNARYVCITTCPSGIDYTFSDGSYIGESSLKFFKVEPIYWKVLRFENKGAFLLSEKILDSSAFLDLSQCMVSARKDENGFAVWNRKTESGNPLFANNWQTSTVREMLNGEFLNNSFSPDELTHILETENNNTYGTMPWSVQSKTLDRVFLLSFSEATDSSLGFSDKADCYDSARCASSTDYARARGLGMRHDSVNGYWWLRTSGSTSYNVCRVYFNGYVNATGKYLHYTDFGVRPAIKVIF